MLMTFNHRNQAIIGQGKQSVLDGSFLQTPQEEKAIKKQLQLLWKQIPLPYRRNITGIIRFDCAPQFEGSRKQKWVSIGSMQAMDLGRMRINGLYEVNSHAPECTGSILRHRDTLSKPLHYMRSPFVNLSKRMARYFNKNKVHILPGRNRGLKNVDRMCRELRRHGVLRPEIIDEKQLFQHGMPCLWRFGDLKNDVIESEYSPELLEFLKREYRHRYMNCTDEQYDISNKALLTQNFGPVWQSFVGHNCALADMDQLTLMSFREQWVIKAFSGTRGKAVYIGKDYSDQAWFDLIQKLEPKADLYGVYEAKFLEPFVLNNDEYVADLNPTCWVDSGQLTYLYTMCRLSPYEVYSKNHLMNVSLGATLGGMVRNIKYISR